MQRFSNTWSILKASWELLKKDKEMLIFSLLSGICCLIVTASFHKTKNRRGTHVHDVAAFSAFTCTVCSPLCNCQRARKGGATVARGMSSTSQVTLVIPSAATHSNSKV